MSKTVLALAALIALSSFVSAYAQETYPLIIKCNVDNAQVFVDERPVAKTGRGLVIKLPEGRYSVRISKPGYEDYVDANVVIQAAKMSRIQSMTALDVTLRQAQPLAGSPPPPQPPAQPVQPIKPSPVADSFPLSVDANVRGAQVYLNGQDIGRSPLSVSVYRGSYEIRVSAPGYQDFVQRAEVRAAARVTAILQPMGYQVLVNSNVSGATVLLNGQEAGHAPLSTSLAPGSYDLTVRAPGYLEYRARITIEGPQTISAFLQGAPASWRLIVSEAPAKSGKGNQWQLQLQRRELQFWIDGAPVAETEGQLSPGRHVLRLASGDLVAETTVEFQAGRSYVFEPFLGIGVK